MIKRTLATPHSLACSRPEMSAPGGFRSAWAPWPIILATTLLSGCSNPDQFNLLCKPTDGSSNILHVAIDIKARVWGVTDGKKPMETSDIVSSDAATITLSRSMDGSFEQSTRLNRHSGVLTGIVVPDDPPITFNCERGPFTGLPRRKF